MEGRFHKLSDSLNRTLHAVSAVPELQARPRLPSESASDVWKAPVELTLAQDFGTLMGVSDSAQAQALHETYRQVCSCVLALVLRCAGRWSSCLTGAHLQALYTAKKNSEAKPTAVQALWLSGSRSLTAAPSAG